MTSSSNRILKRPDKSGSYVIEQYVPPVEQLLKKPEAARKRPLFPRYDQNDMEQDEFPAPFGPEEEDGASQEQTAEKKPQTEPESSDSGELRQLQEEAERTLEEARRTAQELIAQAEEQIRRELEEAREKGHREGYENGYRDGRREAEEAYRQELAGTLQAFRKETEQALRSVEEAKERCLHTWLEELKDCAIAVGEKVIHISLKSSGEVIRQMIISATEKLKKTAWVKIYIDKFDYDMMMEADTGILDQLSHLSDNIKFIVMDKEERGNCIIEMPEEIVDVSVNTQIENIRDILENVGV